MIYKEPTIYKIGNDEEEITYKYKSFKKQTKYTQINDFSVGIRYNEKVKICNVYGWFSVSASLNPTYNSSDIGGSSYWPALFYIDNLPDEFFEAFNAQTINAISFYSNVSDFFAISITIDTINKVVSVNFANAKSITNTTTTVNFNSILLG